MAAEIDALQLGYKIGFINDSEVWLLMLKKRNTSVHIYNEDEVDEMIMLIRDSFIPAFIVLRDTLVKKLDSSGRVPESLTTAKAFICRWL